MCVCVCCVCVCVFRWAGKKLSTKVSAPLTNFDPTPFLATSLLQRQAQQRAERQVGALSDQYYYYY